MDALDFSGKTSNEILEELALAAEWLAEQYAAAKPFLSTEVAEAADADTQGLFFWNAHRSVLPVLATCARHLIVAPPPPPIEFP